MRIRKLMPLILVIVLLVMDSIRISALEYGDVAITDELDLPQGLNFSVSNTCTGHDYFMQAAARDDGCFLVYSRYVDTEGYSENTFRKVYIDIYEKDGSFLQEISFETPLDLVVVFADETINIYFYGSVLVYAPETQALYHYAISNGAVFNSGLADTLRQKEFVCGDWKYSCRKDFNGYTKLIRSDGVRQQTLVQMPGTGKSFWNIFFPGVLLGVIGVCVWIVIRKKHTNRKTGDGAVS